MSLTLDLASRSKDECLEVKLKCSMKPLPGDALKLKILFHLGEVTGHDVSVKVTVTANTRMCLNLIIGNCLYSVYYLIVCSFL